MCSFAPHDPVSPHDSVKVLNKLINVSWNITVCLASPTVDAHTYVTKHVLSVVNDIRQYKGGLQQYCSKELQSYSLCLHQSMSSNEGYNVFFDIFHIYSSSFSTTYPKLNLICSKIEYSTFLIPCRII